MEEQTPDLVVDSVDISAVVSGYRGVIDDQTKQIAALRDENIWLKAAVRQLQGRERSGEPDAG